MRMSASPRETDTAPITVVLVRTSARAVSGFTPPAADLRKVVIDIVAVARIVLGVHNLEVLRRPDAQAEARQPRLDDARAPDQDRAADAVFQQHLRRPQHALVLAVGEDHALLRIARDREDRLHHEAGAVDEAVQPIEIGVPVRDRAQRDAVFSAARATAGAILRIRRGSKGEGIRYSGPKIGVSDP